MERLTEQNYEDWFCLDCQYSGEPCGCNNPEGECDAYALCGNMWDKLAAYEDAEEQGRLIVLPCDRNATVYFANHCKNEVDEYSVMHFDIGVTKRVCFQRGLWADFEQFGKTVFLTRAEAEAAMERGDEE